MNDKRFYVTTPIYYVNALPHIGHAYTTIVGDVLKRYYRLAGYETYYLTGTDEHGDKIAQAAEAAKIDPKKYVDGISDIFRKTWQKMNINNDGFIRTTDPYHIKVVKSILQKVYDNGDIYFGEYGGYYCFGCERFYTEKELVDGKCPDHKQEPTFIKEQNYFFRMSKYQDWLVDYIKNQPEFIRPERYKNEILSFLKEPLEDLCISRPKSRLTWGITLPFDENYVTYVWFDALINYISGLGYPDSENFKRFWPVANHLIAKDILKPHAVYWPTMLKSAGIEPYQHLHVHGYWNMDRDKISKTLGNVVRPLDLQEQYGLDAVRYYLMREMIYGRDADFSTEALETRINSDLANDLGNLFSRSLAMNRNYFSGKIPEPAEERTEDDRELEIAFQELRKTYTSLMEKLEFSRALGELWGFINRVNRYIVKTEPWTLARDEEKLPRLRTVMYNILESLNVITYFAVPFLPDAADKMLEQLGYEKKAEEIRLTEIEKWGNLIPGRRTKKGKALFPRLKTRKDQKEKAKEKELLDIKDFTRFDLRVGKVLEASRVEGSEKLLKLKVDIGRDTVPLVAGIGKYYQPEDLVGRLIIVLTNLKPVQIFGIESRGMLLAASNKKSLELLRPDRDISPGARVS